MAAIPDEIRKFFVWFNLNPDAAKIVVGFGQNGDHYTIRFWSLRKCLDLHITNEKTGLHETLFEITYESLLGFLQKFEEAQKALLAKYWLNTINLGRLKHHDCVLFAHPKDDDDLGSVMNIKPNKIRFKKNPDLSSLGKFFLTPEEIPNTNHEMFQVYKFKKGRFLWQGFLYKLTGFNHKRRFFFVNKKSFNKQAKSSIITIFNLLKEIEFKRKDELLNLMYEKIITKYPRLRA